MFLKKRLKATQTGITIWILKENRDIFSVYISDYLSEAIRNDKFPAILKMVISRLFSKKLLMNLKKTIDQ